MEERRGEAFAGNELLTVMGRQLHAGESAPNFCLEYVDLADQVVRTISLADSTGIVRLLSMVNSLDRLVCQRVTRQWEALCAALPSNACIYTVSRDSPQMQAQWQDTAGVLHQLLSAQRCDQFGQDYGVWLKQWRLLQRAVFVLDRLDRIVYAQYVADQLCEPDYTAALQTVLNAPIFFEWIMVLHILPVISRLASAALGAAAGSVGGLLGAAIGAFVAGKDDVLGLGGAHALLEKTGEHWGRLRAQLDREAAWPIGFIYGGNASPIEQHQVLAIAYTDAGNGTATLTIWDNNDGTMCQILKLDFRGDQLSVDSSKPELNDVKGIICEDYAFKMPPTSLRR